MCMQWWCEVDLDVGGRGKAVYGRVSLSATPISTSIPSIVKRGSGGIEVSFSGTYVVWSLSFLWRWCGVLKFMTLFGVVVPPVTLRKIFSVQLFIVNRGTRVRCLTILIPNSSKSIKPIPHIDHSRYAETHVSGFSS